MASNRTTDSLGSIARNFRFATAIATCFALIGTSWPVISLAAVTEFNRHPERVILRHADALGLSTLDRAILARRVHGVDPKKKFEQRRVAPEFDKRLAALDRHLIELGASTPEDRAEISQLVQQFREDRDALEAEWDRLAKLWEDPKIKPVRDRLLEQRRSFRDTFSKLESLTDALLTSRSDGQGASEANALDRAWLRSIIREQSRSSFPDGPLPFTRRTVGMPIQPAITVSELEARLHGPKDSTNRETSSQGGTEKVSQAGSASAATAVIGDPPVPADLAETIEVQFTPDIQALATSLNNSPVEIFNWVRNNITFAAVTGSIQGADHCLQTRSCSDVDTASLLIALLRVSGIPARYQLGTVDIPEEAAKNWVGGADTLQVAGDVLATGGIPGVIFNGDRLRIERIWVRAFVDMNPSRGAVHIAGDTWVDMDPAFKQYENTDQLDISASVPTDLTIFDDVLASGTTDPITGSITSLDMDLFVAAYLAEEAATQSYFESTIPDTPLLVVMGSDAIIPSNAPQLPGTLPYNVIASAAPFAEVSGAMRHTLTIRLTDEFGGTIFSVTKNLAELAGLKLAVTYDPASPADEAAIESLFTSAANFEDIPTTISSSINFRANLKIDDVSVATGTSAGYGTTQNLYLDFNGPLGARSIPGSLTTGGYYVIGLDVESISPKFHDRINQEALAIQAANADPLLQPSLTSDSTIGTMLQAGMSNWFFGRDMRDHRLAKGARIIAQRLPSTGLYFNSLAVSTLFGSPVSASAAGATLDIANDFGYALAKNGDSDASVAFAYMQGQTGSEMEASIQEVTFSTEENPVSATSTMRILQQANDEGIPIYTITNANSATILPLLQYGASDMSLVTTALAQGREVIIPETQVVFAGNPITGLITQDPVTGSAAYLISGGLGVHSGGLAEFLGSTEYAIMVAVFFGIVAGLFLFSLISAAVALFAAIAAIVLGIIGFFMTWSDIVEGQPDSGLSIGQALAGFGIIGLFAYGLVTGIAGLFAAVTLPGILLALAVGIISILIGAWLKEVIVGLLEDLFDFGRQVLWAQWEPGIGSSFGLSLWPSHAPASPRPRFDL